mmetsp:Transcript_19375/g.61506  ORF Transcript_19375/g.61506 Transcript_19375/m.61506 type:complete len:280 (-) Transcript_19375:447-1286(-)
MALPAAWALGRAVRARCGLSLWRGAAGEAVGNYERLVVGHVDMARGAVLMPELMVLKGGDPLPTQVPAHHLAPLECKEAPCLVEEDEGCGRGELGTPRHLGELSRAHVDEVERVPFLLDKEGVPELLDEVDARVRVKWMPERGHLAAVLNGKDTQRHVASFSGVDAQEGTGRSLYLLDAWILHLVEQLIIGHAPHLEYATHGRVGQDLGVDVVEFDKTRPLEALTLEERIAALCLALAHVLQGSGAAPEGGEVVTPVDRYGDERVIRLVVKEGADHLVG